MPFGLFQTLKTGFIILFDYFLFPYYVNGLDLIFADCIYW